MKLLRAAVVGGTRNELVSGLSEFLRSEAVKFQERVSEAHDGVIVPHVSPKETLEEFAKVVEGFEMLVKAIYLELLTAPINAFTSSGLRCEKYSTIFACSFSHSTDSEDRFGRPRVNAPS